jgi:hypothetical protein
MAERYRQFRSLTARWAPLDNRELARSDRRAISGEVCRSRPTHTTAYSRPTFDDASLPRHVVDRSEDDRC